jgi:thymidine phosphorylase
MKDPASARHLAESMRTIGTRMGKRVVALLTSMDQPLGRAVGNALEVAEAVETLKGGGPEDFRALCRELTAWMLVLGGAAAKVEEGRARFDELVRSGAAAQKFRQIIQRQGGEPRVVDDPKALPQARQRKDFLAPGGGYLAQMDAERLGRAAMALGAGRARVEDMIDPAVGLIVHKKVGDCVERGQPLATLHYNDEARLAEARHYLEGAFTLAAAAPAPAPLILETLA